MGEEKMSEQYSITIPAHPNIYSGNSGRELRIDFSIPDNGVNNHTGLLLFVPGFGGNIDSKVYKKMRKVFSDTYNMVTIQCHYFGSSSMQGAESITIHDPNISNLEELERVSLKYLMENKKMLVVKANFEENIEEFNDMSYLQAIDLISAVEAVKITLKDNNLAFNSDRVIGYGHSHGAYLLHLCNILVPHLFSFIVDNSAWIEPVYLSSNRYLFQKIGKSNIAIEFDYIAKEIIKNKRDLNLNSLYENYTGNAQIVSFQGNSDNLVDHKEKERIIEQIVNSKFILVTNEDIDDKKYKSNGHGLDADFLELFSYALEFEHTKIGPYENPVKYNIEFSGVQITVDYTLGLPIFKFDFK
jgi:hypothetical protein